MKYCNILFQTSDFIYEIKAKQHTAKHETEIKGKINSGNVE
jgi:hypothetical protein